MSLHTPIHNPPIHISSYSVPYRKDEGFYAHFLRVGGKKLHLPYVSEPSPSLPRAHSLLMLKLVGGKEFPKCKVGFSYHLLLGPYLVWERPRLARLFSYM
jgi:hypothetical protein